MIHLDTSFLIRAMLQGSAEDRRFRAWLHQGTAVAVSAIAWAEFLCGPVRAKEIELLSVVVPEPAAFTAEEAALAATLFNATGRRRGTLLDCMIAATAIRCEALLATANSADFARFLAHGLRLAEE